jgi:HAD superfamily hydrolase (TIGR01450 family)
MAPMSSGDSGVALMASDGPLFQQYQRILLDLDGVVILDEAPIPAAVTAVSEIREAGVELRFLTNNASRPPEAVAQLLRAAGVAAQAREVLTSAMAAAGLLAGRFPPASPILVVGGAGVTSALDEAGLRPVFRAEDQPVAVLQGFSPEVGWPALAEAAVALRAGAAWVATNTDRTLPSPRGPLPGNGSMIAALATATDRQPESVGKPARTMYDAALNGAGTALAVGDRLETDIAGAVAAGLPSLAVLSGVSTPGDLVVAGRDSRPGFIGRDLGALQLTHPAARLVEGAGCCGEIRAVAAGGEVRFDGPRTGGEDGLDALRALCALAWSATTELESRVYENAVVTLDLNY